MKKPRLKFDLFVLSPHVPLTCPQGAPEKEGRLVCAHVYVCVCVYVQHAHTREKKCAKTDRDKQINRQIEIDRLTVRRGKIRERRHEPESLQRLREEDTGRLL